MIIGFTGSRYGMTLRQYYALRQLFTWLPVSYLRHGDDIGSDSIAHDLFTVTCNLGEALIHPCNIEKSRAWKKGHILTSPLPPLQRDRYIAGEYPKFRTDLLIATPLQNCEIVRSGTWATVRYARKAGTPRIILLP